MEIQKIIKGSEKNRETKIFSVTLEEEPVYINALLFQIELQSGMEIHVAIRCTRVLYV